MGTRCAIGLEENDSTLYHRGKDLEAQRRARDYGGHRIRIAHDAQELLGSLP